MIFEWISAIFNSLSFNPIPPRWCTRVVPRNLLAWSPQKNDWICSPERSCALVVACTSRDCSNTHGARVPWLQFQVHVLGISTQLCFISCLILLSIRLVDGLIFPNWGLMMKSLGEWWTNSMRQPVFWVHHKKVWTRPWKNQWMNPRQRRALPFPKEKRTILLLVKSNQPNLTSQNLQRRKKKMRRRLRWKKPMARTSTRCPRHACATAKNRLNSSLVGCV